MRTDRPGFPGIERGASVFRGERTGSCFVTSEEDGAFCLGNNDCSCFDSACQFLCGQP